MNRAEYLTNICDSLAILSKQVEIRNSVNLYDINIISEDFYNQLLNMVYGYDLKNLNIENNNVAAIDLGDGVKRVSIQVTSDNTSNKIKKTISKFIEYEHQKKYDRLIILILTEKKKYKTDFDTKGEFIFHKETDIIDPKDLAKALRNDTTDKLKKISDFLDKELKTKENTNFSTEASEVETIIDLIEHITSNREINKKKDTVIDPEFKIDNRFLEYSKQIKNEYVNLLMIYGEALDQINQLMPIDDAQEIIIMLYLQDISVKTLEEMKNHPIKALNKLVDYFEEKISVNGKRYDRAAIKFYLVNETIKCNIFPNERTEYNDCKQ